MHPPATTVTPQELLAHARWVRGLARALTSDAALAADVEQETWLAALRRPPAGRTNLRSWLAKALRHRLLDSRRSERRRSGHQASAALELSSPSTDELVERAETRTAVAQAVLALAEPYRSTILLRFFEELKPREIAARLGVPVETVHTRTGRALAQLRVSLDATYGGDNRRWRMAVFALGGPMAATTKAKLATAAACALLLLGAAWIAGESLLDTGRQDEPPALRSVESAEAPTSAAEAGVQSPVLPGLDAATGAPSGPNQGIALVGRVLDDRRSPVAGATVEALDRGEPGGARTTDADGRFQVEGLPRPAEGGRSVAVRALGSGGRVGIGSTTFLQPSSPDVVDVGEVLLGKGIALTVRVVESDAAVRDARVALWGDRVWLGRATTGADGVAHLGPVPQRPLGILAWTLEPPRAGRGTVVPGGPTGDSVTIAISPARVLEVVVVEAPSGRPIEGAVFDVAPVFTHVPAGGAYGLGAPLVSPTGADGRTRVLGTVADDELSLHRARAPGFDGEGWFQKVGAGEREARLEMRARRTLRFEVREGEAPIPADGTPIRLEPAYEGGPTPAGRARMEGRTLVIEGASPFGFSAIAIAPDDSYARPFADAEVPPPGGYPNPDLLT